jgi:uncharacterized protein YkwD
MLLATFAIPAAAHAQDIVIDPNDLTADKINQAMVKKGKGWIKGQAKAAGKDWIFATGQSATMEDILEAVRKRSEGDDKNARGDCKGAVMGEVSSRLTNLGYKTSVQAAGLKMFDTATKMAGLASGFGGAVTEGGALNWVIGQYSDAAAGKAKDSVFDAIKNLFIEEKQPQFEIYETDGTVGKCDYKLRAVWDIVHGTYSVLISGDCHCEPAGNTGVAPQKLGKWWITFKGHLKITIDKTKTEKTVKWVVQPVDPDPDGMRFKAQCNSCPETELPPPFIEKQQTCPPPAPTPLTPDERAKIEAEAEAKKKARDDLTGKIRDAGDEVKAAEDNLKYTKEHPKADPEAQKKDLEEAQQRLKAAKDEEYRLQSEDQKLQDQLRPLEKKLAGAGAKPGVSYEGNPFAARMLSIHNSERAAVGSPPLQWNPILADHAQAYANELARDGQLAHASRAGRGDERENLSEGNIWWTTDQMMQTWLREKKHFVAGTFPNVSDTGNWSDVGHYSQMVWSRTTEIGCGEAQGSGFNWLVCRYSPGGNKDGQPVLVPNIVESAAPPCPEDSDDWF